MSLSAAAEHLQSIFLCNFFSIHRFASPVVVAVASDDDDEWPGGSPLHLHERSASLRWRLIILDKSLLSPFTLTPTEQSLWSSQGSDRVEQRVGALYTEAQTRTCFLFSTSSEVNVAAKPKMWRGKRELCSAPIQGHRAYIQQRRRWTHFRFRVSSAGCWLREKSID